jgi:hypothetical protein
MQPRYVCTLKMGYCSLSCGWMGIRSTLLRICYTQVSLLESLLREVALHFTVCLLTNSSTELNTTDKWLCILTNSTCSFESLGEKVGLHSVIIPKRFFKIRFSCLWHTHCVSYSLHIIVHIWKKTIRLFPVTTFFPLQTPSPYQKIFLMHTKRWEIANYSLFL